MDCNGVSLWNDFEVCNCNSSINVHGGCQQCGRGMDVPRLDVIVLSLYSPWKHCFVFSSI